MPKGLNIWPKMNTVREKKNVQINELIINMCERKKIGQIKGLISNMWLIL